MGTLQKGDGDHKNGSTAPGRDRGEKVHRGKGSTQRKHIEGREVE